VAGRAWIPRPAGGQPDQPRERVREGPGGVVGAWEHGAAGEVGLRGGDFPAEGDGVGERLGTRITSLEHVALDVEAGRHPRCLRTNLDDDLAVVSQPKSYDGGEVPGSEDLIRWRSAEMLHAPLSKEPRVAGKSAR
jgi:hypothetical protein